MARRYAYAGPARIIFARTVAEIQPAIDELEAAGGGVVWLPAESTFTLTGVIGPILLPRTRTSTNGEDSVWLMGSGPTETLLTADATFPVSRSLIEWKPTAADKTRCDWQRISGMTIRLPLVTGTKAIWRDLFGGTPSDARWTGEIDNLRIQPSNQYHDVAIHLEGNVHKAWIHDCWIDPAIHVENFNTDAIRGSDGTDSGGDDNGFYESSIERVMVSPTRGGYAGLFRGRIVSSHISDCQVGIGGGPLVLRPSLDLRNSYTTQIAGCTFEGNAEDPTIYMESCHEVTVEQCNVGFPFPVGTHNSIELVACERCEVRKIPTFAGNPSFAPFDRVTLDATCQRCHVEVDLAATDTMGGEISDASIDAWIETYNVVSDVYETNRPDLYVFGITGVPVAGTFFPVPGASASSLTELKIRMPRRCTLKAIGVRARVGPGGVLVNTFTVRVNGVNVALATTLTGAAIYNRTYIGLAAPINLAVGDDLSVSAVVVAGSTLADVVVIVETA